MEKLVHFLLLFPDKVKGAGNSVCSYKICLLAFLILFSSKSFAQTPALPDANSCVSKDLLLVGASLPAPNNDPCACDGIRNLWLEIDNKTGSRRIGNEDHAAGYDNKLYYTTPCPE